MDFKSIFKPFFNSSPEPNPYLEIRKESFFLNEAKQQEFIKNGYCVIENVVEQAEIDSFMQTFDEISKLEGFELDKNLLNSGRLFNPEIRKKNAGGDQ